MRDGPTDHRRLLAVIATTTLACACGDAPRTPPPAKGTAPSPVDATEAWRAKHAADYRRDWASIAGLHPTTLP
jgi:hypothetical protein